MNKEKEFALYKGDKLLFIGTKKQLAKEKKVKVETISFFGSPTYRKRTSEEKGIRLVRLEDV